MADLFGHNFTGSNNPNWVPEPERRGTFNILSTCLVTLGLCVWTAIHVNVPEHKEGWVKQLVRKAGWTLMGLVSPEAVSWSTRDPILPFDTVVSTQLIRERCADCIYSLSAIHPGPGNHPGHEIREHSFPVRPSSSSHSG